MTMKKRNIVLYFIIFIISSIYIIGSQLIFRSLYKMSLRISENTFEIIRNKNIILFIVYKESGYIFGSGHKYLILFSKNKMLLDIRKFGEFPISVQNISENEIVLKIKGYDSNKEYIDTWIRKNRKIWRYKIIYILDH